MSVRINNNVAIIHSRPYRTALVRLLAAVVILMGHVPGLWAQTGSGLVGPGGESGKSITIPHLMEEPVLDGVLDEAIWSRAVLVNDLHQMTPDEYSPPSQYTEVRVFYSDDALYVGVRLFETDPERISAKILRQGQGLGADDIFVLMLDPYLDRRSGYEFEISPNSIREEGLYKNGTSVDRSWEGIWQAKSGIDSEGWVAEMRIPFQTISFNPDSDTWGINFRRAIRRNNELIAWVSRNRQMNPSIAGTATGFDGLRQGLGLDVVPSMLIRQEKIFGPQGSSDDSMEPQLDLFYKVTPQLNAALTLNTDFSATNVDDRQVNLSRFNLFFPERRDFFTRDVDIFEFGQISQNGRPFFSRRIGLSASGAPVDINAGAKLSGRVGNWSVGSLLVSQAEDPVSGLDSRNVFVGRAARNVLSESQIGMIMTAGNPQSDLDNSLVGADFRYRNSRLPGGKVVQGNAWYQQTDSEGLNGADAAYGFGLSSPNNVGWKGSYNFKRIEKNFNPALGFVNQTDYQDHSLDISYWHYLQPGAYVRSINGSFDSYRSEDLNTHAVISEERGVRLSAENNPGDGAWIRVARNREVLQNPFTINRRSDGLGTVVIPAGDYVFNDVAVGLDISTSRVVSGNMSIRAGEYYDGNRVQRQANLNWRPVAGYQFGMGYTENEIHLRYGHFTVRQANLTSQISFVSSLTWSNRIQYDNVSELLGFNSRLHWIPEAGRQAFLVLNYGLSDADKDNNFDSVNRDLSLKFNYTFRF